MVQNTDETLKYVETDVCQAITIERPGKNQLVSSMVMRSLISLIEKLDLTLKKNFYSVYSGLKSYHHTNYTFAHLKLKFVFCLDCSRVIN